VSNTTVNLRRLVGNAEDLQSVVRTMKAMAATSIGQYENSVLSLQDYYRTVELALGACIRGVGSTALADGSTSNRRPATIGAIVFGSDQGLVGQFNDTVADCAIKTLAGLPAGPLVWAVGERVHARLVDAGLEMQGLFNVPNSVQGITALVGRLQLDSESILAADPAAHIYVFHNRPRPGALYRSSSQKLLPLDKSWRASLATVSWPTGMLPEILGASNATLQSLIREYLFISLYQASAESLAAENACRLAAMERADKNIDGMLGNLRLQLNQLRQADIDEELFDLISGFEALAEADEDIYAGG